MMPFPRLCLQLQLYRLAVIYRGDSNLLSTNPTASGGQYFYHLFAESPGAPAAGNRVDEPTGAAENDAVTGD
jgi:hypothetical protein